MSSMKREVKNILGMPLDEWKHKSCTAHFSVFPDEATLYDIVSKEPNKGHAFELLSFAKEYYEKRDKKVMGTVALNEKMSRLYKKIGIGEYK